MMITKIKSKSLRKIYEKIKNSLGKNNMILVKTKNLSKSLRINQMLLINEIRTINITQTELSHLK